MGTTWVVDTRSNSQPNQVRQQRQNYKNPISQATAEGQISRTSCTKPHAGGASTRKHTQEHMQRLQMVISPHSRLHTGGPCTSFSHQERPSKQASQRKPNAALRKAADGLVTTPETAHAHRAPASHTRKRRAEQQQPGQTQRAIQCKAAPSSRWSDHHMSEELHKANFDATTGRCQQRVPVKT